MKKLFFLLLLAQPVFAYEISGLKVGGEKEAWIQFTGLPKDAVPSFKVVGNTVELGFPGADLSPTLQGKVDLESPHALVQRVGLYSATKGNVRAKVVLNGTTEGLNNRVAFAETPEGLKLKINYPKGDNPALSLLEEEQKPVLATSPFVKKEKPFLSLTQILLSIAVILSAAAFSFFAVRFMKSKESARGARKFLIEQLGYCSMGNKTGVSLIKVGSEFILIGVTPTNVQLLSTLPKLEQQYESESQYERGVFKEAFEEEFQRLKRSEANA